MNPLPKVEIRIDGAHRVGMPLAKGRFAIYWYRHRGGPPVMKFVGDNRAQAEAAEAAAATDLAKAFEEAPARAAPDGETIGELITLYKAAPDGFLRLEASTRSKWGPWLDIIREDFGGLPTKALKAKGMKREIIRWRNKRAATPRTADYGLTVLRRLLSWSVENEYAETNPSIGIAGIYKPEARASEIVYPEELRAILPKASLRAQRALRLAADTGLRRGDLVRVKASDVGQFSISMTTSKSGKTIRVIVPLFEDSRAVVAEILAEREAMKAVGVIPSAYLLTSSNGKPWKPDSVTQAWIRACDAAGVEGRTLHDLRGTACTRYIKAGSSDEQIAEIFGWTPDDVKHIRRHYVDRENIALGVIEQLEKAERTR